MWKHESHGKERGGMLMRNNLTREMCAKEFVCTRVTFGFNKSIGRGWNKQLTLLRPRCSSEKAMKYLAAEIEIMLVFKNTKQGVVNYLILTQGNIKRVLNELTPAVTEGGGEIRPKARNKVSEREKIFSHSFRHRPNLNIIGDVCKKRRKIPLYS